MAELVKITADQHTIATIVKNNPKGFIDSIASIVSETIQVSGRKDITDADKTFLIIKTKEEIENEYSYLTGAEIRYAFAQGVRGRYGDYYHINLATFIKWIDKYLDSDERQRVVNARRNVIATTHRLESNNKYSENDINDMFRQKAEFYYQKFLETGFMPKSAIKSLNSVIENLTLQQLVKDKKALPKERILLDVFNRYKIDGKKSIY